MSTHRPPFPIGWLGFEIPAIELVPVALVVLLVGRHSLRLTRAERDVATRLAQCNDPRAISALVEALSVPDRRVQRPLVAAVTSILSWVTPDDEPLFTERNRRFMVGVLGHVEDGLGGRYYGEQYHLLVLATLHAVAQIGDQRAVDSVRHLAYLDAQNAHQEEVRKVARTCLPLLEARVAAQRVGAGLLRAADQPAADALLRAASSSIEPDGALLRPAPSPTHECLNSDLSD